MSIILIHGPRQSGKSTMAGLIENRVHVNRFSFADAIRESVCRLRPITYRNRVGTWNSEMLKSDAYKKLECRIPERNFIGNSVFDFPAMDLYRFLTGHGYRSPGVGDIVITVRDLMRQLGDYAKWVHKNEDYFVDDVIQRHRAAGGITLVDDLRFPQEIHKLVRLGIPTYAVKITGRGETDVQHTSDIPLPDELFNHIVDNSEECPDQLPLLVAARRAVKYTVQEGWHD